jgi:osmotically inducible lipoprotein OsmB
MKSIWVVAAVVLLLSGCADSRRDYNATSGALIGGTTGAVIGGVTQRSVGGVLVGGLIGAGAGAIIGAALTPPGPCYIRTSSGRLRRVRCH